LSGFACVDGSPDPARLLAFLDMAAVAESGMKHYAAAAHALRAPEAPIIDLGCGAGHDLVLLGAAGLPVVGVDPSAVMVAAARRRAAGEGRAVPLVRADGGRLPLRTGGLGGCRMERVLMHVEDPGAVLAEVARCVRPGGLVTVCEPDWSRFTVRSDVIPGPVGWMSAARHPGIGGELWGLMEDAGFAVEDQVEELSVWRTLERLERITGFPLAVERAVARGQIDAGVARRWVAEQRARGARGILYATLPKIQIVAARR